MKLANPPITPSQRERCEKAIAKVKRLRHDEDQYAEYSKLQEWASDAPAEWLELVVHCALTGKRFLPDDTRGPMPEENSTAAMMTIPEEWISTDGNGRTSGTGLSRCFDADANGGWSNVARAFEEER
jgi:hypothetical protein